MNDTEITFTVDKTPTLKKWLSQLQTASKMLDESNRRATEEHKAKLIQQALMGLPVVYTRHYMDGKTPNMARTNGFSIAWHQYAYGSYESDEVEVRLLDGDCVRVKISELPKVVSS